MTKDFDVVIFGASGFTGQFVVDELAKTAPEENIRWAVAGRNRHKIVKTLDEVRNNASNNLNEIKIFEADITDQNSLENMCKNAKLVINCVGPYEQYGESVVMACLKHRTHLIDMTVEIMYIIRMILRYHHEAESQEVYMVSACGIGYLPLEMSIPLLQQKFEGGISEIDLYIKSTIEPQSVHTGTWESLLGMTNGFFETVTARQEICSQIMNRYQSKWSIMSPSWPFKFSNEVKGLGLLIPSVLYTTPLGLDMKENVLQKNQIKLNSYCVITSWLGLIQILIFVPLYIFLMSFSFGKRLLHKYPEFFSFGIVSKFDSSERNDVSGAHVTAVAKGWRKKHGSDQNVLRNPDKTVVMRVSVPPAYRCTAIGLVHSAITILKETDRLPNRGGIYTPLAAFSETSLPSRLRSHGMTCQVNIY